MKDHLRRAPFLVVALGLGCTQTVPMTTEADVPRAVPCTSGMTIACPCANGSTGAQTCDALSGSFSACRCVAMDAGASADIVAAPDVFVAPEVETLPDRLRVEPDVLMDVPMTATPDRVVSDVHPDVERDATSGATCTPNATGAARTLDFVIHQYIVDGNQTPSSTARPVFGFDLDGVRSPVIRPPVESPHCVHGDFFSRADPDQHGDPNGQPCAMGSAGCAGGVDNQLPAVTDALGQFMAGLDVARLLSEQLASGREMLVLRVSDVNGAPGPSLCDHNVTLRVYRVYPLFAECSRITQTGASYAIARSSLVDPTDPSSAIVSFPAQIVNGRVQVLRAPSMADRPSLSLPFPISGVTGLSMDLFNTQIRFSVLDDGSVDSGNLGGIWLKRDLLTGLGRIPQFMPFLAAAAPLFDGFVDIATPLGSTQARCTGMGPSGREEGGIGVGLGFRAVAVTLTSMVLGAPPPGACGAP